MGSKRKFKRDYIILEAKDMNFRSKERVLPKAFAKIEINDEKSVLALYVENLKNLNEGYDVVALRSDYEKVDLGKINLNSQGKGEFILDLAEEDSDIKAVALVHDKCIPLIGFKGSKIDNYEELIFEPEEVVDEVEEIVEYAEPDDVEYEYEEVEYVYEDDLDTNEEDVDLVENTKADKVEDIIESKQPEEVEYVYEEVEYIEEDDNNSIEEIQEIDEGEREQQQEIDNYEKIDTFSKQNECYNVKKMYNKATDKTSYINLKQKGYKNKSEIKKLASNKSDVQAKQNTKKKTIKDEFNNIINVEPNKNESAGKLLMPRQIKKGLKYFKEVKPFAADYIENTRWWKIDINPTTMCGYTMPYLGYINTLNYTIYSDIAMNSYKYRHYLFGVQYDEYNKRKYYIYAIPGKKAEQPDKGTTGFTSYQACDNRNNSLGYWLCFIDSRARKIVK